MAHVDFCYIISIALTSVFQTQWPHFLLCLSSALLNVYVLDIIILQLLHLCDLKLCNSSRSEYTCSTHSYLLTLFFTSCQVQLQDTFTQCCHLTFSCCSFILQPRVSYIHQFYHYSSPFLNLSISESLLNPLITSSALASSLLGNSGES